MHTSRLFFISVFVFLVGAFFACHSDTAKTGDPNLKTDIGPTGNPAIDALTLEIAKNPGKDSLFAARAKLFYQNKGYDNAIADMAKAMHIDSLNVNYHHFLADIYMDYAQSRLALKTMERAAELYPKRIPTLLKLSEFQNILRQYNESMKTIDQILKIDPQNSEAFFMMGMNFKEMGDTSRAINSFQTSVENNPDNIDAYINLGALFGRKNNPIALKYFDNALRIDSLNTLALFSKAVYYQNRFIDDKAIDLYRKIVQIDPHYSDAYFNTGVLYLEMDSLKKAWDNFNIIILQDPLYTEAYYYRGMTNERMGKKTDAINDYKQAVGQSPSYIEAKKALEKLEKK